MRTVAIALALVLACGVARADEIGWSREQKKELAKREKAARTKTALDVYAQVDPVFAAELSMFMDLLYEQFQQLFPGTNLVGKRPEVYVFAAEQDFKTKLNSGGRGFYRYRFEADGKFSEHALYTFVEKPEEKSFARFYHPILMHEGTHQVLRERFGKTEIPPAFNKGLATFFQLWKLGRPAGENVEGRADAVINREEFVAYWERGQRKSIRDLLSIKTLAEWDPDSWGPRTKAHYAAVEGWFLFLMSSSSGRKTVKAWWDEIAAGRDPLGKMKDSEVAKLEAQVGEFVARRVLGKR